MDGLTLSYVRRELEAALAGGRVDRVLQPERDELDLVVRTREGTRRVLFSTAADSARVHLTDESKLNPAEPPMFCMLLRKLLVGARVAAVRQLYGDRILEIDFDGTDDFGERAVRVLSCELMGRHSNLILRAEDGRILDAIRHVGADMSRVREVKPGLPYLPPPPQEGRLNPETATEAELASALRAGPPRLDRALGTCLSGLSAQSAREISFRLTGQEDAYLEPDARAALAGRLRALLDRLPAEGPPVLVVDEDGEATEVWPFAQKRLSASCQRAVPEGISHALDAFYRLRDRRERIAQKTAALTHSLRTHLERCEKKLALHREALERGDEIEELRVQGELLTAGLYLAERGQETVRVPDYYGEPGATRDIPLDVRLTPAQNAQKYFKRYQKLREGQKHAEEQAALCERERAMLEEQLDDLRKCETVNELDEIRAQLVQSGLLRASHTRGKPRRLEPSKPLCFVSSDGLTLRVGKNAAQNDRLTLAAPSEALWLHAKDMAGSHVIVEGTPGESVPETTLREAANLAAFYSRGYRSAQVPVDYTLRKYVRKPAGAPAGRVIYTRQRTLFVTPDERAVKKMKGFPAP